MMAPAASSVEEQHEAQIAWVQAARDQRGEDRDAAFAHADVEAAAAMDNGVSINPLLRQMYGP